MTEVWTVLAEDKDIVGVFANKQCAFDAARQSIRDRFSTSYRYLTDDALEQKIAEPKILLPWVHYKSAYYFGAYPHTAYVVEEVVPFLADSKQAWVIMCQEFDMPGSIRLGVKSIRHSCESAMKLVEQLQAKVAHELYVNSNPDPTPYDRLDSPSVKRDDYIHWRLGEQSISIIRCDIQ